MAAAEVREGEVDGHAALTLRAGPTEATFVPSLGMLGTSLRHHGLEHLDLGGGATRVQQGHTTGLPLLAPWANRIGGDTYRVGDRVVDLSGAPHIHRDGDGLPIHGTMLGQAAWRVLKAGLTSRGAPRLQAAFDASEADDVMASFPFPHTLVVTATVRPGQLAVRTVVLARGSVAVPVSFGWHPYFRLPDEALDDLEVELPALRHVVLDDRMLPTGEEVRQPPRAVTLRADGFDDAYRLGARSHPRSLVLRGRRRRLSLTPGVGYHFAQVYEPGGSPVVALEPMVAAIDALGAGTTPMVAPGERYAATFRIDLAGPT